MAKIENGLEMDPEAGEAFEAPLAAYANEAEPAAEAIPAAKPKPKAKKAKPAPVEVEPVAPKVGVCARVHQIADAMRGQPRAEIIARAVAEGINKGTVRVQLSKWARLNGWEWPEETPAD